MALEDEVLKMLKSSISIHSGRLSSVQLGLDGICDR